MHSKHSVGTCRTDNLHQISFGSRIHCKSNKRKVKVLEEASKDKVNEIISIHYNYVSVTQV